MTASVKVLIIFLSFTAGLIIFAHPNSVLAQVGGNGAQVIEPIKSLWQLMRNISYLILTLILVVVGLMIMFRAKINPQTVVGLQQALPGIIISLIVITFSFLIASLIIDLAFLLAQLFGIAIVDALSCKTTNAALGCPDSLGAAGLTPTQVIANILNSKNVFFIFKDLVINGSLMKMVDEFGSLITDFINQILGGFLSGITNIGIPGIFTIGDILNKIIGSIGALFIGISLISTVFRLFMGLVTAFTTIILNTIFGPLLILSSAIPGRGSAITDWLRGLLANVLVFPVLFGLFVLIAAILGINDGWYFNTATITFNQSLPLFGGFSVAMLRYIAAYGLLMASSGIPDFIKQIMKASQPQQLGQAVAQSTATGTGGTSAVTRFGGTQIISAVRRV